MVFPLHEIVGCSGAWIVGRREIHLAMQQTCGESEMAHASRRSDRSLLYCRRKIAAR